MPRPPIRPEERVRGVRCNLLPSTWEQLRTLAFEQRTTISEQMRRAVEAYLTKQKGKGVRRSK